MKNAAFYPHDFQKFPFYYACSRVSDNEVDVLRILVSRSYSSNDSIRKVIAKILL
jgi:hypothetical protein